MCVPWYAAHVSTGHRDRARWQDHVAYLHELKKVLRAEQQRGLSLILAGDFNQQTTGPLTRVPTAAQAGLRGLLAGVGDGEMLALVSGALVGRRPVIDHIAVSCDLARWQTRVVVAATEGVDHSDHDAIVMSIPGHQTRLS